MQENPADPQMARAILSLVGKGKGKGIGGKGKGGKGKGKGGGGKGKGTKGGKGKGAGFQGKCFWCDETGHVQWDCPKWDQPKKTVAELTTGKSSGIACCITGNSQQPCKITTGTPPFLKLNMSANYANAKPCSDPCCPPPWIKVSASRAQSEKALISSSTASVEVPIHNPKHFVNNLEEDVKSTAQNDKDFPDISKEIMMVHKDQFRPLKNIAKKTKVSDEIEKLAREIERIGNVRVNQGKKAKEAVQTPTTPVVQEETVDLPQDMPPVQDAPAAALVPNGETVFPSISIEIQAEVVRQLNLLTSTAPAELNAVKAPGATRWVKVPIAMDSGSMANVTPPSIFSCIVQATEASKNKEVFHGADNSAILNLGSQFVSGKSDSESPISLSVDFEVANISRPLGSVSKLVRKQNKVVFDEGNSYIENKKTKERVPLREENGLYFLDIWVEIPEDMVINPLFARQVVAQ